MGWFDNNDHEEAAQQWNSSEPREHEPSFAHELIAGAASFEAAKAYEEHCERNGKPESHQKAKELLAGFAGAFIDREVESKGLDFLDKEKAKYQARQNIEQGGAGEF
ncbi:hypothetical protein N7495_004975 [Penicillium taxi]|uniref:uncharacterized protein n=1 Tax=Penicillium taxi TaxID=168475 RepID=UPI0025458705|nr:uncharacterized protein N7495_004975 [Penicillium taxi]KAJ5893284.1 hypothetical protein N7495_004975 [Penicillium taxi]